MAVETVTPAQVHEHARQWEHTALTTELLLAFGAVVLSILGIVGLFPTYLAAIAVIGLGAILSVAEPQAIRTSCDRALKEPNAPATVS